VTVITQDKTKLGTNSRNTIRFEVTPLGKLDSFVTADGITYFNETERRTKNVTNSIIGLNIFRSFPII
jgi:hypothetical protein